MIGPNLSLALILLISIQLNSHSYTQLSKDIRFMFLCFRYGKLEVLESSIKLKFLAKMQTHHFSFRFSKFQSSSI